MRLYRSFWLPIPIIILLGLVFNKELTIDAGTGQTTLSLLDLMLWYGAFLAFSGLGYYIFRTREMNSVLKKLHWGPTLIGLGWLAFDTLGWIGPGKSDMIAGVILLIGTGVTCYLINMTVTIVSLLLSD
ncbi:MAG: hypothetical protein HKN45_02350 [Flavobacteriales bacterium]|nr:hypothetical protein [Flavobacteriales bacterium]